MLKSNYKSIASRTILALLLISGSITSMAQVPDSAEFREAWDNVELFDGNIIFGKAYSELYFGGPDIDALGLKAFDDQKQPVEFRYDAERNIYRIKYLDLPIIDIHYQEQYYRITIELVQVDWPGNEINWRMIPRVHMNRLE